MPRSKRSKNWCFTDFNCKNFNEEERNVFQFIGWGHEKCPRTGKMHHQGFLQTRQAKTLRTVKLLLGLPEVHLEEMRGTPEESVLYCKKDGSYQEYGVLTKQGQRGDIDSLKLLIQEGKADSVIAETNFQLYCQYSKGLSKYRELMVQSSSRSWRTLSVVLIRGETGTGKTRFASRYAGFRIGGHDLQWWDGYSQEKCILIDEYSNDVSITKLLSLLDGYQQRLAIKGGFTYAAWTTVFITTNLVHLHANARESHRRALRRRITLELQFPLI